MTKFPCFGQMKEEANTLFFEVKGNPAQAKDILLNHKCRSCPKRKDCHKASYGNIPDRNLTLRDVKKKLGI